MAKASIPIDGNHNGIQLTPAVVALTRAVNASLSSSTTITFNAATTILRCYAATQDVYLKWGSTAVTSSNFDEVIPAGQIVDLYIPVDSSTTAGSLFTTCRIIERAASASFITIEK